MAGAGYKLFASGDVLTAEQVNTYLQQQTIMVFADDSARDTALNSVKSNGMFAYILSDSTLQYYDGSSWNDTSLTADITGVTAGDGLSGGGTSGTVSLALDLNELTGATVNVANDSIAIVDADDSNASKKETIADLATAMAGTNITASSGVLSASGGKVLQIVTGTTTTDTGVQASTSFVDTGLTADITPSATSSKVLVLISQTLQYARDSGEQIGYYNLLRDSTELGDWYYNGSGGGSGSNFGALTISTNYMDSPSSTSALTYKTQIRVETTANSGSARANQQTSGTESPCSIQLIEIGA